MAPSPGPIPLPPASSRTAPSRTPHPSVPSAAPAPAPTPHDTHSPHSLPASAPALLSAVPLLAPLSSLLPLFPSRLPSHPAARTAPSAPPHLLITAGSTPHVPLGSLPISLPPQGSGTAAAPAILPPSPTCAPESLPASLPVCCDLLSGDGATASSAIALSPGLRRHTPSSSAPASSRSAAAAGCISHTSAALRLLPTDPVPPLPHPAPPSSRPPAPARSRLPTALPSAGCRASRSPLSSLLGTPPAAPGCRNSSPPPTGMDRLLLPSSDGTVILPAAAPADRYPAHSPLLPVPCSQSVQSPPHSASPAAASPDRSPGISPVSGSAELLLSSLQSPRKPPGPPPSD